VNRDNCLTAHPEQMASLSNLQLTGCALNEAFKPSIFAYTADLDPNVSEIEIVPTATSRRYAALRINGVEARSGQPFATLIEGEMTPATLSIEVVSPDRSTTCVYMVKVNRK